jgi:hypothetical protein
MAEARRAERAPSPDSMDLYFRGMSAYNKGFSPDNLSEARLLFERALALDPGNVDAIVGAALTHSATAGHHMTDDRATHIAAAEKLAFWGALDRARERSGAPVLGSRPDVHQSRRARHS